MMVGPEIKHAGFGFNNGEKVRNTLTFRNFDLIHTTYKWEFSWLYKFSNSQMPLNEEWKLMECV